MRRLSKSTPIASCFCSAAEKRVWIVRNSQSSRAARLALIFLRKAGVRERTVCRPSFGSGAPLTSPAAFRTESVSPMDCGRIPWMRASVVTVAGPSRSSRLRTCTCDGVKSPTCGFFAQPAAQFADKYAQIFRRCVQRVGIGEGPCGLSVVAGHTGRCEGYLRRLPSYLPGVKLTELTAECKESHAFRVGLE